MRRVCILTDSTAQFPTAVFPGNHLIDVIPLHVKVGGELFPESQGIRAHDLPVSARFGLEPEVLPPTQGEFQEAILRLARRCDEVVLLLGSSHLLPLVERATEAVENLHGAVKVHVVDSQSTAAGLGLLVQAAADLAVNGIDGTELKRRISGMIPHIYTILCVPGLTYLQHAGLLGPAQAVVGEMLNVMPLFVMEDGQLVAIQKARSSRHLVDSLHEFVCEFVNIHHIAIVQGAPPFVSEVRSLRERFSLDFPDVPISEHTIGPALAALLGPRSLGLFVQEDESEPF